MQMREKIRTLQVIVGNYSKDLQSSQWLLYSSHNVAKTRNRIVRFEFREKALIGFQLECYRTTKRS